MRRRLAWFIIAPPRWFIAHQFATRRAWFTATATMVDAAIAVERGKIQSHPPEKSGGLFIFRLSECAALILLQASHNFFN